MAKRIEDCPFCGGNHIKLWGNFYQLQVACLKCGALGPKATSETEALKKWNAENHRINSANSTDKPQQETQP